MAARNMVSAALAVVAAVSLVGCGGDGGGGGGGGGGDGGCTPDTPLSKLLQCSLLKNDGYRGLEMELDVALKGKSNVAIFFGASWCPFTRAFVDGLFLKTIEKVKAKNADDTEVVLLWTSVDTNRTRWETAYEDWNKDKPWLSVPFATSMGYHDGKPSLGYVRGVMRGEPRNFPQGILAEKYGLDSIPYVVVLGQDGEIKYKDFLILDRTAFDEGEGTAARLGSYSFNEATMPPSWLEVQDEVAEELMLLV